MTHYYVAWLPEVTPANHDVEPRFLHGCALCCEPFHAARIVTDLGVVCSVACRDVAHHIHEELRAAAAAATLWEHRS